MGSRLRKACAELGISVRTYERWSKAPEREDQRRGPLTVPANKLSEKERQLVLDTVNSREFCDLPPSQIAPRLADKGEYIASESTMYRILREEKMLEHRGKAKPRTHQKPQPLVATGPNQVWSWDISYLLSSVKGIFFYAYIFEDVFSRKIVAGDVYERELGEHASLLFQRACLREGVSPDQLALHSDNGSPMKGATMLATLQRLGVVPSFSRPKVCDDNAYIESLFRTMKYRPDLPLKPFETIEDARAWLQAFIDWYNNHHLHSGIKFVAPADRHAGLDIEILERRKLVYQKAREMNPNRWTRNVRDWSRIEEVTLNPEKQAKEVIKKAA